MIIANFSFLNSKNISNLIKTSEYSPRKIHQATQAEKHFQELSEIGL